MTILISKYPVFRDGLYWVEVLDVLGSGARLKKSRHFSNPYLAQAYCNVLRADPYKTARDARVGYSVVEDCPLGEHSHSCPSVDRSRLSPDCVANSGGYCVHCGAGSDHS